MMRRLVPFGFLLALAACATPQERCINSVTRDLRTVTRLIAETEGNLARGFAIEERVEYQSFWDWCQPRGPRFDHNGNPLPPPPPVMCERERQVTRSYPVAIDLAAEKQKLVQLQAKQKELNKAAAPQIEQCRIQHPETERRAP